MTNSKTPQASDALAVFTHTGSAPDRFELHDKGVVSQPVSYTHLTLPTKA